MEKLKADYNLSTIKAIVARDGIAVFTATARSGFMEMGLSAAEAVVASLSGAKLFESMTTHVDSSVWQDVYHAPCPNGKTAYIKLTMQHLFMARLKRITADWWRMDSAFAPASPPLLWRVRTKLHDRKFR